MSGTATIVRAPEIVKPGDVRDVNGLDQQWQVFDYARLGLEYLAGHIPGSLHVDKSLVWTEVGGVAGMLPPALELAAALGAQGFDPLRPALVLDGGNGLYASRLAWALAVAGWERVALLEGGLAAWKAEGLPVKRGTSPRPEARPVRVNWQHHLYATFEEVRDRPSSVVLLDTRSHDEYTGRDRRSRRAGRIPGAVHWEWKRALDSDGLSFRPGADLAAEFGALGIGPETSVITYCQSGVRASHALLALHCAGITQVKNYDGSWEEWGNRLDTPVVTGGEES